MRNKKWFTIIIVALVLTVAIPVTYTFAWFANQNQLTGSITLKEGIHLHYTGLQSAGSGSATTHNLIIGSNTNGKYINAQPADNIEVTQVSIYHENKANSSNAVLRFKLTYSYAVYAEEDEASATFTTVAPDNANLHIASNITVNTAFKKSGDYYYYVGNNSTVSAANLQTLGGSDAPVNLLSSTTLTLDSTVPANHHIKILIEFDALQQNSTAISTNWGLS